MLQEIRKKAEEIGKQVVEIGKAQKAYDKEPVMRNGIKLFEAIGKLLLLTSELCTLNIELVKGNTSAMRKSRIKDNLKVLVQ